MEGDCVERGATEAADPTLSSSSGGSKKKASPCEECAEQPWKYRCPGCARLTCSLPCVQAHKRRTACTGKRPRTDPVPLARFDDNQLLSDYNFLEETNRAKESAHRLIAAFGRNFGGPGGAQLPTWLFFFRKAAHRRGTKLYFLPRGMARREQNRSRYNHRKNCIYWTLEWRFHSANTVLTDHEIDEHATLLSLLEKHLNPGPWKDQLTQYRNTDLRDLKLFIQKSAKESESPYRQLNIEEPLGPQLRGTLIVEYPTINVFLPSDNFDFEVEKMVTKLTKDVKPPDSSTDVPHLEGIEFQEEEIEEGEFAPDTQIIDIKESGPENPAEAEIATISKIDSKADSSFVMTSISIPTSVSVTGHQQEHCEQNKQTPSATTEPMKRRSCTKVYPLDIEDNHGLLFPEVSDLGFEQEMRDNYPELFGDMDTDDFFSYDDLEMINGDDPVDTLSALLSNDLEDGEIPSL